jgi:hypothetical protein
MTRKKQNDKDYSLDLGAYRLTDRQQIKRNEA